MALSKAPGARAEWGHLQPTPGQALQRTLDNERANAQLSARDKELILSKKRMLEESHEKVSQLMRELAEAKQTECNRQFDALISEAELMAERKGKNLFARAPRGAGGRD